MADLQTEIFTKVLPKMQQLNNLTFDDGPDASTEVVVIDEDPPASETERIYRFVRDNPGSRSSVVAAGCPGIRADGVSTRLNQLSKRGLIKKEGRYPALYTVTGAPYVVMTEEMRVSNMLNARSQRKHLGRSKKKPAPEVQVAPVAAPTPAIQVTPVDLNNLSIVEARKLYDELKQIFGA